LCLIQINEEHLKDQILISDNKNLIRKDCLNRNIIKDLNIIDIRLKLNWSIELFLFSFLCKLNLLTLLKNNINNNNNNNNINIFS